MGFEETPPKRILQTFDRGAVVFAENAPGREMFIVHSGRVGLYREADGKRRRLATVEAGDFFGEMSLVDDSPRSATAVAELDDTRLLVLDQAQFAYLIQHQPDFALTVMGKLCRQIRAANCADAGSRP